MVALIFFSSRSLEAALDNQPDFERRWQYRRFGELRFEQDRLRRRSFKLGQSQSSHLQKIPRDSISEYVEERKISPIGALRNRRARRSSTETVNSEKSTGRRLRKAKYEASFLVQSHPHNATHMKVNVTRFQFQISFDLTSTLRHVFCFQQRGYPCLCGR
jgi:hypothetical protein